MHSRSIFRALSALCLVVGTVFGISFFFSVREIACTTQTGSACPPQVLSKLEPLKNRSLFFTDFPVELKRVTASTPFSLLKLHKELPSTIVLVLYQEPPAYSIQLGENHYAVYESGSTEVSQENNTSSLPITYLAASPLTESQEVTPATHQQLLTLTQTLHQYSLTPTAITWVSAQEVRVVLSDELQIVLDANAIANEVAAAATVVQSSEFTVAQTELEPPYELDVRFKLPVLRSRQ